MTATLDELALKHRTDKSSDGHDLAHVYDELLTPLRDKPIIFLELGWGGRGDEDRYYTGPEVGGESARMWREYFTSPNAQIIVIDKDEKNNDIDGVEFYQVEQTDAQKFQAINSKHGNFSVILDDCSHISSLTIRSWEILYPMLAPGGIYIVEDTHASYHEFWYGKTESDENPDTTRRTTMAYFKRLADEVNFIDDGPTWWGSKTNFYPAQYWLGYRLESVQFRRNCVIIKKASNCLQSESLHTKNEKLTQKP